MSGIRICGGVNLPDDIPDTGGSCCQGSAIMGPTHCTCWTEEWTLDQQPIGRDVPMPVMIEVRPDQCDDCAYRADSKERAGDPNQRCSDPGELDHIARGDVPFWCHDGLRRLVALVHPSGARYDVTSDHYDPPIIAGSDIGSPHPGVPFKADGSPAFICAGWDVRRKR